MRWLSLLLFLLLLAPSAALGEVAAAGGDGSLVVSSAGARIVVVHGQGLVFGHITKGTLSVVSYRAADSSSAQVSGSVLKLQAGSTTQYTGSDILFLLPNGRYTLQFEGVGIDISAVGRGAVSAIGIGTAADGTMATNGGKALPLGLAPTTLVFGAGKAPNATPTSAAKASPH